MNKKTLFAFLILCLSLISCNTSQVELEPSEQYIPTQVEKAPIEKLNPTQVYLEWVNHYTLGIKNAGKGNIEKAISEFTAALEIDPQNANIFHIRGMLWHNQGNHDKAILDFDRAIALAPNAGGYVFSRGVCFAEIGEKRKAISDLENALELGLLTDFQEMAEKLLDELSQ